ncbi:hypothetical protein OIU76_014515 [Salix suchowensis]|uniref:Uncharacterized protein n=1 Tax=Salix suchowensis TaxID=1278906 RepID=A0ABQ8ZZJ5_9ROSI|nr:hypothetical protein OIU76_014515 [Salix suchowensis]KAJ6321121.1 hypothetical protein OIU77_011260 [Salix suchowensis]KAJ6351881.1 hypothetical protein OIU78_007716 [Salix suchowensis]
MYATDIFAHHKLFCDLNYCELDYCHLPIIPKGKLSQMLLALCDTNQIHLYNNTCNQRKHPSLLCTSGEDLSTCSGKHLKIWH